MDSFLFIGYRYECSEPKSKQCGWNHRIKTVKNVPINKGNTGWVYWNLPNGNDVFLYADNGYYKCPFGHNALWSRLNDETLDLPDDHDDITTKISNDPILEQLVERYNKVVLRYGIMKGLG